MALKVAHAASLANLAHKHSPVWGRTSGEGLLATFSSPKDAWGFAGDVERAYPSATVTVAEGEQFSTVDVQGVGR